MIKRHLHYIWQSRKDSYRITPRNQNSDPEEQNTNDSPNYIYQKKVYRESLNVFSQVLKWVEKKKNILVTNWLTDINTINKFRSHYVNINTFWRIPNFFIKDFKNLYKSTEFKFYANFNRQVIINMDFWDLQKFIQDMWKVSQYHVNKPDFINDDKLDFFKLIKDFSYYSIENRLYEEAWSTFLLQFFQILPSKKKEIIEDIKKECISFKEITPLIFKLNITDGNSSEILSKYASIFDDIQVIKPSNVDIIISPNRWTREKSILSLEEDQNNYSQIPTVWIIDSWISESRTILTWLIDQGNSISFVDERPLVDSQDHGTWVASLVIFWDQIHLWNRVLLPNAKVVSIKVLSAWVTKLELDSLFNIVKDFYKKWVKIFNMSVNYQLWKEDNQTNGWLTYLLDYILSYYKDVLFFISSWNVSQADLEYMQSRYWINFKFCNWTNICIPADSTNAISVWGIWEANIVSEFSRKNSLDYWTPLTLKRDWATGVNKITTCISTRSAFNYKPDFVNLWENIKMLSSDFTNELKHGTGTSFSAPLVCNVACRILKQYPTLSWNAVKALLLNSSSAREISVEIDPNDWNNIPDNIQLRNQRLRWKQSWNTNLLQKKEIELLQQRYIWFGKINQEHALYSDTNRATFIIQDSIKLNYENIYEINIPENFASNLLDWRGFIKIKWSISYNHIPILSDHLNYNPIHMWFRLLACSEQELRGVTDCIKSLEAQLSELTEWTTEYEEILSEKKQLENQKDRFVIQIWWKSRSQDNYYRNHYANNQSLWNDKRIKKETLKTKIDRKLFVEIRCNLKTTDPETTIFKEIKDYIWHNYQTHINESEKVEGINRYLDQFFGFCLTIEDESWSGIDIHQSLLDANIGILSTIESDIAPQAELEQEVEGLTI